MHGGSLPCRKSNRTRTLELCLTRQRIELTITAPTLCASSAQEGGVASELPLGGSVVQRLQRYGTYGHLKQVVLAIIANEIAQQQAQTQSTLQQLKCAPTSTPLQHSAMSIHKAHTG